MTKNEENEKLITHLQMVLISKEREIEKLKKEKSDILKKLKNRVKEVKRLSKYYEYKKEFCHLNKLLKRKDNIINKMTYILSEQLGISENKIKKVFSEIEKRGEENEKRTNS